MGKVQTWSMNKKEGTIENVYVPDIKNARMLAFDWLGQCLYWAGKANTVRESCSLKNKNKKLKSV